jgi:hypothetical protein
MWRINLQLQKHGDEVRVYRSFTNFTLGCP